MSLTKQTSLGYGFKEVCSKDVDNKDLTNDSREINENLDKKKWFNLLVIYKLTF